MVTAHQGARILRAVHSGKIRSIPYAERRPRASPTASSKARRQSRDCASIGPKRSSMPDASRTHPELTAWDLTNALLDYPFSGSDTAAREIVGNAGFGTQAQTLKPPSELQAVRLY